MCWKETTRWPTLEVGIREQDAAANRRLLSCCILFAPFSHGDFNA